MGDVLKPPIPTVSGLGKPIDLADPGSVFNGAPGDGGRPKGFEFGLPFFNT